jgi:dihydroorotate dehydrogenase (fumarate)
MEREAISYHTEVHDDTFGEALTYFPRYEDFNIGPGDYLKKISELKGATHLPVIASLNGVTRGGWVRYAADMEAAGADALELNFYHIATSVEESGGEVEERLVEVVIQVREHIQIPIAVKLSPFYSALPHLAAKLVAAGANGLILFNRFYQPDIDIEMQETIPRLQLSDSSELPMRLRWIAALYGNVSCDLILSGGVHEPEDAIKGIMTGASGLQVVSSVLKNGPSHIAFLKNGVRNWMREHEFESLSEMRGSMSMQRCPDPQAFERTNYMRILQGWRI